MRTKLSPRNKTSDVEEASHVSYKTSHMVSVKRLLKPWMVRLSDILPFLNQ